MWMDWPYLHFYLFAVVTRKPKFQTKKRGITEQVAMEGCSYLKSLASFRMHVDLLKGLGNQKQMHTLYLQMLLGFFNWDK